MTTQRRLYFYEPTTQQMANTLPLHYGIRTQKESVGQLVMSAAFGVPLAEQRRVADSLGKSAFLISTDLNEPSTLRYVDLPDLVVDRFPEDISNFLRNSNFSITTNPHKPPEYWYSSSTVVLGTGMLGGTSCILASGEIYQDILPSVPNTVGQSVYASVWYKSDLASAPASNYGISVDYTYVDGTTASFTGSFVYDTSGDWQRLLVKHVPTKKAQNIRFRLLTSDTVEVSKAMLTDTGNIAWEPYLFDMPSWMFDTQYGNVPVFPGHLGYVSPPQIQVNSLEELWGSPPTRTALATTNTGISFESKDFSEYEFEYHSDKSAFRTYWKPNGTKLQKIGLVTPDIYGDFDIYLPAEDGNLELATVDAVHCATTFGGQVYAVVTTTDTVQKTLLCWVQKEFPRPAPDYIECWYCVELPAGVPTPTEMRFQRQDPRYLFLLNGTTEYVIRLYYDYALYERRLDRFYLREDLDDTEVIIGLYYQGAR